MENENGILTGYSELDDLIGNLYAGDFVAIGSRPSGGKTTFCLLLVKNISIQNKTESLVLLLEMSTEKFVEKLLIRAGIKLVVAAPLYIEDRPNISLGELKETIKETVDKFNVKIVFIDYLGLVSSPNDEVFNNLKSIALEFKIVLVALFNLNRSYIGTSEISAFPVLNDVPESFQKNADIILLLHRGKNYTVPESVEKNADNSFLLPLELSVTKNRIDGKTGIIKISCAVESHFNYIYY